jgi:hypothetical protein
MSLMNPREVVNTMVYPIRPWVWTLLVGAVALGEMFMLVDAFFGKDLQMDHIMAMVFGFAFPSAILLAIAWAWLASHNRRQALSTLLPFLSDWDDGIEEAVIEMVMTELKNRAGEVMKLQGDLPDSPFKGSGYQRAQEIKSKEMRPLFDAAKLLGLLPQDVATNGYEKLFKRDSVRTQGEV